MGLKKSMYAIGRYLPKWLRVLLGLRRTRSWTSWVNGRMVVDTTVYDCGTDTFTVWTVGQGEVVFVNGVEQLAQEPPQ